MGINSNSTIVIVGRVHGGGIGKKKKNEVELSENKDYETSFKLNLDFQDFNDKYEIKFTSYDQSILFLEVDKNILVSDLKAQIKKKDNCLVNSKDFLLCYNEVNLEDDMPLINYVDKNLKNINKKI